MTQKFTRKHRLLKKAQIDALFDNPISVKDKYLVILSKPNEQIHPRLGFVISKKKVKTAVQRNRIKRLVRESMRLNQKALQDLDILIIANKGIDTLTNAVITTLLDRQWTKLISKSRHKLKK